MSELLAVAARVDRAEQHGALRALNAFIAECDPDLLALYGIGAGDALAFATRFARAWGYHRRKALFVKAPLTLTRVGHRFLPGSWWRRSILQADARGVGEQLSVLAVTISAHPERRDIQLERLRDHLAGVQGRSLVLEPDRVYASGAGVLSMDRRRIAGDVDALVATIAR